MNKARGAQVRDELLQRLYASTLRSGMVCAAAGLPDSDAALAAGIAANLRPDDLLLLPRRGAPGLRVLRDQPAASPDPRMPQSLAGGILLLPLDEAGGAHEALGAAAAAKHAGLGSVVVAVVPAPLRIAAETRRGASPQMEMTWGVAAAVAARGGLPLLLASLGKAAVHEDLRPEHLRPAPLYPSIPVDAQDALAVYRVVFECVGRAREGLGPSHIAGVSFAVRGQLIHENPLAKLESVMRRRGVFSKAARRQLERQILRELETEAPV